MKTVFLSHSQQDEQLATRLKADLTKRGLTVRTIDLVEPGEDLRSRIGDEVKKADAFLALITPAYLRSRWATRELEAALTPTGRHGPRIIPVIGQPLEQMGLPPLFWDVAQVNLAADYEKGLGDILAGVSPQRHVHDSPVARTTSRRLFEILLTLGISAASSVAPSAVSRQPADLLVPLGSVASLTALIAVLSSLSTRRGRAPVQIVKRNVEAAFIDALEESALNPVRGGARYA